MPVEKFKIVNEDGSVNQSEYNRCINFLNSYVNGDIKVYPELTWSNPFEVDMSTEESALEILSRIILYQNNRLLNKVAFSNIKKLFTGILDRYGSTIHSYGRYLDASKNFKDGPGYMYDVFTSDEKEVKVSHLNSDIDIYYINDDNHTVIEYNDRAYSGTVPLETVPTTNYPNNNLPVNNNYLSSNVEGYPNIYKGNLCGVYSDFQRLSGQYVGSSTLFYYSECNDVLYTTGGNNYTDSRLGEIINFNYKANVSNKSRPARGVDFSLISQAQESIDIPQAVNAKLNPEVVNPSVNYLTPTFFTSLNETDWK